MQDVIGEGEGQVAGGGEGGRGGGVQVGAVRGDEVAPDVLCLWEGEGVQGLGFREGEGAREEEEVERVSCFLGGRVFADGVDVFAAEGGVVGGEGGGEALLGAEDGVVAFVAGEEWLA